MKKSIQLPLLFLMFFMNFLLHINYFTQDIQGLHSWRQSQTMWNIRNFVRHDSNILNPRINIFNGDHDNVYRYEFPLMQWSIAMLQKIVGERIEVVRIIMFLVGIIAALGLYFLIKEITNNEWSSMFGVFLFQLSPIFYYYSLTPLPDIWALTFGIWYIVFIQRFIKNPTGINIIFSSLFLLLSTLTKLPYLMYASISIYLFVKFFLKKDFHKSSKIVIAHILFLLPAFLWYAWVMPGWTGNPVLVGIFKNDVSSWEFCKLIGFHCVKMIPNKLLYFPVWIPFGLGIYSVYKDKINIEWLYSVVIITIVYLFLQLTTIGRDHDYYLLPFLPWLFVLVAIGLEYIWQLFNKSTVLFSLICLSSICYTKVITKSWNSLEKTSFNRDVFIHSESLKNAVPNNELCIILNDPSGYIFSYQIDKMGYFFRDDYLPIQWIYDLMVNHKVKYIYSDSQRLNNDEDFRKYVKKVILKKKSVSVFELEIPNKMIKKR